MPKPSFAPNQPVPSSKLRTPKLTPQLIDALNTATKPSREDVSDWLRTIRTRLNWSRTMLAAVLRISAVDMRDYEIGRVEPIDSVKFLIWLYLKITVAPAVAFNLQHQVTWGKVSPEQANIWRKVSDERKAEIIAELKKVAESKYKIYPYKITVFDLSMRYRISKDMARSLARKAGYTPKRGKAKLYKRKRPLPALQPHSIWMHIDWRLRDREIAHKHQIKYGTVKYARNRFRKMPKSALSRQVANCDVPRKHFWPFIGPHAKPYRGRSKPYLRKPKIIGSQNNPCTDLKIIESSSATTSHEQNQEQDATTEQAGTRRPETEEAAGQALPEQVHRGPGRPEPGLRPPPRTSWSQANRDYKHGG